MKGKKRVLLLVVICCTFQTRKTSPSSHSTRHFTPSRFTIMDAFERTIAALQLLGLGRWPRLISEYLLTPRPKESSRLSASRDETIPPLELVMPSK